MCFEQQFISVVQGNTSSREESKKAEQRVTELKVAGFVRYEKASHKRSVIRLTREGVSFVRSGRREIHQDKDDSTEYLVHDAQ